MLLFFMILEKVLQRLSFQASFYYHKSLNSVSKHRLPSGGAISSAISVISAIQMNSRGVQYSSSSISLLKCLDKSKNSVTKENAN